ncbi:TonB-dependent receptor [Brucella pseudogrignonensis]|uniref:TonB-dependent siderophore receptor n=1 Tax=Brucella pseudogrignonensis TaxID=419475 RepID=UPI001E458E3C|nr:TonB-dependent receptor [Brucella pseudogrignonensis]MCD4514374.1 TonB-dependent receptor [Brucella pseudogrignonensis]
MALLGSTFLACGILGGGHATHAQAQQTGQSQRLSIPAQPFSSAVDAFSRATGWQVGYSSDVPRSITTRAVSGTMSPTQALQKMFAGTGVAVSVTGPTSAALVAVSASGDGAIAVDGSTVLETITVQGQGATTEGSGSYTTTQMSTATGLPISIRETPQSVSVVTRQKISDKNYQTIDQALQDTPGITTFQGNVADRWIYYSRGHAITDLQYDGLKNSAGAFTKDIVPTDSLAIYDRIEVVRGATGLSQGTGNPAASINLIRKRPTDTAQTSVSLTGSSWGNGSVELDTSSPLNADGSLRGRFVGQFEAGDTYIDLNEKRNVLLYGTIEADVTDQTTVNLGLSYQRNSEDGYAGGGFPTRDDGSFYNLSPSDNIGASWQYLKKEAVTAYVDVTHRLDSGWDITAKGQAKWAKGRILGSYFYPLEEDSLTFMPGAYVGDDRQISFDVKASGPIELLGRTHDLSFGASYQREDFDYLSQNYERTTIADLYDWDASTAPVVGPRAVAPTINDYLQKEYSLYASGRFSITDQMKLIAGGRLIWFSNDADWNDRHYSEDAKFIPYVGLTYDLTSDLTAYASYTTIFKPQAYFDVSGDLLPPLEGNNIEVGLKHSWLDDRLTGSIALFQSDQTNLPIEIDRSFCSSGTYCYAASDEVRTRGVELELTGELTDNFQLSAGYTYARSRYEEGDNAGTYYNTNVMPAHLLRLFGSYKFDGRLEGLTLGAGLRAQSKIYAEGTGWRAEQPAYAVVDLMAKYDFTPETTLQLNVNNVFDKEYYASLGTARYYSNFMGAARNFQLSLRHKF